MCRLRKRVQGLLDRPTSEVLLRLRVVLVAIRIDLVAAGVEHRRREHLRDGAQEAGREFDRGGRREAQLARGRLVRELGPRRRFGARDVFRVRLGDGGGMPGRIDFLCDGLIVSALDLAGERQGLRTTTMSIPRWCMCMAISAYRTGVERERAYAPRRHIPRCCRCPPSHTRLGRYMRLFRQCQ